MLEWLQSPPYLFPFSSDSHSAWAGRTTSDSGTSHSRPSSISNYFWWEWQLLYHTYARHLKITGFHHWPPPLSEAPSLVFEIFRFFQKPLQRIYTQLTELSKYPLQNQRILPKGYSLLKSSDFCVFCFVRASFIFFPSNCGRRLTCHLSTQNIYILKIKC